MRRVDMHVLFVMALLAVFGAGCSLSPYRLEFLGCVKPIMQSDDAPPKTVYVYVFLLKNDGVRPLVCCGQRRITASWDPSEGVARVNYYTVRWTDSGIEETGRSWSSIMPMDSISIKPGEVGRVVFPDTWLDKPHSGRD